MKIYEKYFFIGFVIGIFLTYITLPEKHIIIKKPSAQKIGEKYDKENCNKKNSCYRYKNNIKKYPL